MLISANVEIESLTFWIKSGVWIIRPTGTRFDRDE